MKKVFVGFHINEKDNKELNKYIKKHGFRKGWFLEKLIREFFQKVEDIENVKRPKGIG